MNEYTIFLDRFVQESRDILGDNLVGIYLHGSAVMGCFNSKKSDLDLLIVIKKALSDRIKRQYMDRVVVLNEQAPLKGLELSVVREEVCSPFVYPTPFEIHFSNAHLIWYRTNPDEYIEKMKGTDKDLAAHFTILYHRGKVLYGREIRDVFSEVSRENYLDSIWCDIENAEEEIVDNPVYMILNLCRVLAYVKDNLILSKLEGGEWGKANIPEKYMDLITGALKEYQMNIPIRMNESLAKEYAEYMLKQIKTKFR